MGQIATLYKTGTTNILNTTNTTNLIKTIDNRYDPRDEEILIELTTNPLTPNHPNYNPSGRYITIHGKTLQQYIQDNPHHTLTPTPTGEITLNGTPINSIHVEEADFEYPGEPEHGGWRVPSETCHILLNHLHQLWETITYTAQTLNTSIPENVTNTVTNLSIYSPDAESSIERISSWALAEWEKHPDKSDYVPDDFGSESLNPFSIFTETTPERICSARDTAIWCARIIQDELYTPRSLNPFEAIVVEDATEPPF